MEKKLNTFQKVSKEVAYFHKNSANRDCIIACTRHVSKVFPEFPTSSIMCIYYGVVASYNEYKDRFR